MVVEYSKKPPAKRKTRVRVDERHALWQLLERTARVIAKAREKELQEFGISGDMTAVLFAIAALGKDAIPATIAKILFLEPNSISQQLSKMERLGLVRKSRDLARRNVLHVELAEAGREAYRKSARRRSTKKIMSVLTENERRQMWISLAKLRDASIKELGVKKPILYPPSDPSDL